MSISHVNNKHAGYLPKKKNAEKTYTVVFSSGLMNELQCANEIYILIHESER